MSGTGTRRPIASKGRAQGRDARGRFGPLRWKPKPRRRPVRGPGWLKAKTILQLARHLVAEERKVARLEAELGIVPVSVEDSDHRTRKIRARTDKQLEDDKAIVKEVLDTFAQERRDPANAVELAEAIERETGHVFSPRRFYRHPYDTMWRSPSDWFGKEDIDGDPGMKRHLRRSKQELVSRILAATARRDELRAECDAALLRGDAEGWKAWG